MKIPTELTPNRGLRRFLLWNRSDTKMMVSDTARLSWTFFFSKHLLSSHPQRSCMPPWICMLQYHVVRVELYSTKNWSMHRNTQPCHLGSSWIETLSCGVPKRITFIRPDFPRNTIHLCWFLFLITIGWLGSSNRMSISRQRSYVDFWIKMVLMDHPSGLRHLHFIFNSAQPKLKVV